MAKNKDKKSKSPPADVKDPHLYEALRDEGVGKKKSARVANAATAARARHEGAVKGGAASSYDTWSKAALYDWAKELDIEGRSAMSKGELVSALRRH